MAKKSRRASLGTITSIEARRTRVDVPADQRARERQALLARLRRDLAPTARRVQRAR